MFGSPKLSTNLWPFQPYSIEGRISAAHSTCACSFRCAVLDSLQIVFYDSPSTIYCLFLSSVATFWGITSQDGTLSSPAEFTLSSCDHILYHFTANWISIKMYLLRGVQQNNCITTQHLSRYILSFRLSSLGSAIVLIRCGLLQFLSRSDCHQGSISQRDKGQTIILRLYK